MNAIMRRAFSRFSLRLVFTAVVVTLLTMTAGVTWFLTFRNGQISIRELADQMGRQGMANIRQHVKSYLTDPALINDINSFAFSHEESESLSFQRMAERFTAEIGKFDSITSVGYANEQGESIAIGRQIIGVPLAMGVSGKETDYYLQAYSLDKHGRAARRFYLSTEPYDPRRRPWYQVAAATGAPAWSPVYLMATGDAGIDAVSPVFFPDGRLRGVLDTTLTLSGIGRFLKSIRVTPHSEAFITDRKGMIVASSTIANPYTTKGDHLERLVAAESDDPVVRFAALTMAAQLGAGDEIRAERQFSFRIGRHRQILHVAPFQDAPGIDWLLAEVVPESDFAQHIYDDMRGTAIVVAVFLLLSAFIALLLARRVTAPLELLNTMARSVAAGDLARSIHVDGTDEVSQLAVSFNLMAAELRKSFASLAESEARYRAFVADNAAGIFRFEAQKPMPLSLTEEDQVDWLYGNLVMAEHNEAARDMLGFGPETHLVGEGPGVWLPRSDSASIDFIRAMIRTSFQVVNAESRRGEGTATRWFLSSISGVLESGSLVRIWCVIRDITDRKEAEEALRGSEIRYRAIFHRSAVSLWEVDTSELHSALEHIRDAGQDLAGYIQAHPEFIARALHMAKVVDVNETTLRLFEAKSREELLGPLDATFDPSSFAVLAPTVMANAGQGKQHEVETTVMTRTGRRLNVIMHFHVPAAHDRLATMLVSVIDITKRTQAEQERTRLEEQLRQAQKMETVGRLAGGISHDINNLLTPILGYSELLMDDATPGKKDAAVIILGAAQRIRELTHKLLAFSRKQRLAKSVTDLRGVVGDFQVFLRRTIKNTVEIRVEAPRELGLVTVDVGQVEQVLMNLAINAQDAMPGGGVLTFTLGAVVLDEDWARRHPGLSAGDYVSLAVSDTGTGMDEATRERIFEPFFTTKEAGKGTGLGLSTVYGIVAQHSGHIQVDSEPGWGTVFTIYFPRFKGAAFQASRAVAEA